MGKKKKKKSSKKGKRGKMEEMGTVPESLTDNLRVFWKHDVPHFLSLLGHTHSKVGWPFLHFY
jgi:hypothetical protein